MERRRKSNMDFDIFVIPKDKIDFSELKIFADNNWGDEDESEEEVKNNFFDNNKSAVIAKVDDKLVGLLYIHKRVTILNNKNISFAGIGGVVVHKDYRHLRIATKILEKAIEVLKKDKIDIALLCTDIKNLGKLYNKVGFVPLGRPYYFIQKDEKEGLEKGGMIARVNSQDVFDEILNSNGKLNVGVSNF